MGGGRCGKFACSVMVGHFLEGVKIRFLVFERASRLQFLNGVRCMAFCALTLLGPLAWRCWLERGGQRGLSKV